jgi:putative NADH-flavin reductase
MRVTVFGATGRTGKHVVEQALAAGHEVVAFARTPSKLGMQHERLRVVQGDIHDAAKVATAIAGSDAVIAALSPSRADKVKDIVSTGARNIVAGMKQHGVRRLIFSTGAGVPAPQDQPTLFGKVMGVLLKTISGDVLADSLQGVQTVRESGLDWTIARAPMLTDGPKTGKVWTGYVGKEMGRTLARANFAGFMVRQLSENGYLRQMPALSDS